MLHKRRRYHEKGRNVNSEWEDNLEFIDEDGKISVPSLKFVALSLKVSSLKF
jgi:hypothetical protein